MTTVQFLSHLRNRGVRIWVEGENLRCSAPKGVLTPSLTSEIRDRKAEILDFLDAVRAPVQEIPPLVPLPKQDHLPLSFAQQRLWFLDRLEPKTPVYNIPMAFRLRGRLDRVALERSLDEVVARHEVLRTQFRSDNGIPVQVVARSFKLPLTAVDVSDRPGAEREAEINRFLIEEARRPFDLGRSPLVRAALVRASDDEHVLFFMAHHTVFDGASEAVLLTELFESYEAFSTGREPRLPALPVQYSDFAIWQRKWFQGDVLRRQMDYWCRHLSGNLPVLELPSDHSRPAIQSYLGATEPLFVDHRLLGRLTSVGRSEGATLFMVLLAAFKVLLHRYSGEQDLIVGSPIANRNRFEIEGLIGFFANTLALRTNLAGAPSFRELLRREREVCLGAYSHQDMPFENLVQELKPERDLSRTPIYQVFFAFEDVTAASNGLKRMGELDVERIAVQSGVSRTDLSLWTRQVPQGLVGSAEYSTALFDRDTIRRMMANFTVLLESIAENPDERIGALPLLADQERRLFAEWNETKEEYPSELCLHEVVARRAEACPKEPAVVFPATRRRRKKVLTYLELEERANRIGNFLKRGGVRPGDLVGLYVERSAEMVAALLGILKTGAAYVPLDPAFPPERIRLMLEDSAAPVVLTEESLKGSLPATKARIICLDSQWGEISRESADSPGVELDPDSLAYVIYTSGSTGRPKGVQVRHRGVVNFLSTMAREPGFSAKDVLLSVTTLSFDISVLELFLPLTVGGRVVVASREDTVEGKRLMELLERHGVTLMQATPATWHLLLECGWKGTRGLKVLCGGEALPEDLAEELLSRCDSLWNMYGPTETTVWSTTKRVESADEITVGRPIGNTTTHILDGELQRVPIGVPGELHIGGGGLAAGYRNRAELTAEKFIPDPFTPRAGSRLYKTGDLARFRSDGEIEYLGRLDHQVKIRGFRIELGEIETVLGKHPRVHQAAALVREDRPGDKRLVAYYVGDDEISDAELRRSVKEELPDYMVPSLFTRLKAFPLTPNGKVDRRALPAPDHYPKTDKNGYVAPRDALELRLTRLWEKILATKPVGVNDNFFEVGGHSLLAAQLFARIEKELDVNLPLATLFHAPTVSQLADLFRQKDWTPSWASLVPIQPEGSKPPLFCVHGAGGNVLLYRDLARRLGPDQPVYGLQSKGLDGREPYFTRFEDMAAHYINEIRTVQPEGPYHLAGYCLGGTLALEMARQLRAAGEEMAFLGFFETYNIREAPAQSLYSKAYHLAQNVRFHLANAAMLEGGQRLTFIREKAKVAKQRMAGQLASSLFRAARAVRLNGKSMPHVRLTKVNDKAQEKYDPKPYAGRVTLFRPSKLFAGYQDPEFGWGKLLRQGLDIRVLPVYPRGMLVEPFVRTLAEQVKECLAEVEEGCLAGDNR